MGATLDDLWLLDVESGRCEEVSELLLTLGVHVHKSYVTVCMLFSMRF